ncbi:hypothetical protein L1887_15415 [Cichorium endivia]|nr:hypothetical protein L1887_15415 [Cichorium endivia]
MLNRVSVDSKYLAIHMVDMVPTDPSRPTTSAAKDSDKPQGPLVMTKNPPSSDESIPDDAPISLIHKTKKAQSHFYLKMNWRENLILNPKRSDLNLLGSMNENLMLKQRLGNKTAASAKATANQDEKEVDEKRLSKSAIEKFITSAKLQPALDTALAKAFDADKARTYEVEKVRKFILEAFTTSIEAFIKHSQQGYGKLDLLLSKPEVFAAELGPRAKDEEKPQPNPEATSYLLLLI